MLDQGFKTGYNVTYDIPTTNNDIDSIRNLCGNMSKFCAAGGLSYSSQLILIACGNCFNVTSKTLLNEPVFNKAAYWYYTDSKSFGFSPDSEITQQSADNYNMLDPFRLWWHIEGSGGYRLGKITALNSDINYRKYNFYN